MPGSRWWGAGPTPPTHTDEGLQAALAIRRDHPETGVLVLSQYVETQHAVDLVGEAGTGYLLKDRVADLEALADAVRRVGSGGSAVDPAVVAQLVGRRRLDRDRGGTRGPSFPLADRSVSRRGTVGSPAARRSRDRHGGRRHVRHLRRAGHRAEGRVRSDGGRAGLRARDPIRLASRRGRAGCRP